MNRMRKLKTKSLYRNGKLVGSSTDYYESGEILTKWNHHNGISEGTSYYETGELKSKVKYSELQLL